MSNTISDIPRKNCCIGCGVCQAVCPSKAITINFDSLKGMFVPKINFKKCSNCGLCREVCYGLNPNSHSNFQGCINDAASVIGSFVDCYAGFSIDQTLRFCANSGGVVTAIVDYLLDKKMVDGAIVTKFVGHNPPLCTAFIAKSKSEVESAKGSKYTPVLLTAALEAIEINKHYVFVGLPCHIYAIKKLAKYNPRFKSAFKYFISLFCGGTHNYTALNYILSTYGFSDAALLNFRYRGYGWPGTMLLKTTALSVEIPFLEYWPLMSPWFYLNTCLTCIIGLTDQADIACGDAWLPEIIKTDSKGTSIVIARNTLGANIIKSAENEGYIKLKRLEPALILKAQKSMLFFKHTMYANRLKMFKFFKIKTFAKPLYINSHFSILVFYREFTILIGRLLASKRMWRLLSLWRKLLKLGPRT